MIIKRSTIYIIVALVIVLSLAAVITYSVVKRANTLENDTARKIFSDSTDGRVVYTDLFGNSVDLESYLGKVVVATSWASWSPFTASDLAIQNELATLYEAKPVAFFAINRKETRERAQTYFSTLGDVSKITVLIDSEDKFYQSIAGYAMPETVVFNDNGEIVLQIRGTINKEQLQSNLDELLD